MPTTPGTHPSANFKSFDSDEATLIGFLAKSFYITHGGFLVRGRSTHKYALMRPSDDVRDVLNYDREIIALFSPYDTFEARILDGFLDIEGKHPATRVERGFRLLLSRDTNISEKISRFLADNQDYPLICAFHYKEHSAIATKSFLCESIRKRFHSRDLFNNHNPLRSDQFFFGRSNLIRVIVDRHLTGENSGIFGLRRTGKTSLIHALSRAASSAQQPLLRVDCQSTATHLKRWNELLGVIAKSLATSVGYQLPNALSFDEKNAAESFAAALANVKRRARARAIVAFDEIENISPSTSPTEHWRSGTDSLLFWQTIRAICQSDDASLSFVIIGINPALVENVRLCGYDNPLFNYVSINYITGFSTEQTYAMCIKLGDIMGLNFPMDVACSLNQHFGGNPYLIRQAGSKIHHMTLHDERPLNVSKNLSDKAISAIESASAVYATGMLEVLKQFYPDEFELLCWLSADSMDDFRSFVKGDPRAIEHLKSYGVVDQDADEYRFKVRIFAEAMKTFLKDRTDLLSADQRRDFVAQGREKVERGLRAALRVSALMLFGRDKSVEGVLGIVNPSRKKALSKFNSDQLLSSKNSPLFLSDFVFIIKALRTEFEKLTGMNGDDLIDAVEKMNKLRRDAHSNEFSGPQFEEFRKAYDLILTGLGDD